MYICTVCERFSVAIQKNLRFKAPSQLLLQYIHSIRGVLFAQLQDAFIKLLF